MNTTISISKKTRDLLQDFGKKSESYDDVILRMHNTIMLMQEVERFVDETQWETLEEAENWTKKQLKK